MTCGYTENMTQTQWMGFPLSLYRLCPLLWELKAQTLNRGATCLIFRTCSLSQTLMIHVWFLYCFPFSSIVLVRPKIELAFIFLSPAICLKWLLFWHYRPGQGYSDLTHTGPPCTGPVQADEKGHLVSISQTTTVPTREHSGHTGASFV